MVFFSETYRQHLERNGTNVARGMSSSHSSNCGILTRQVGAGSVTVGKSPWVFILAEEGCVYNNDIPRCKQRHCNYRLI